MIIKGNQMSSCKVQYLSKITVITFLATLGATISQVSLGFQNANLPKSIIGIWSNTVEEKTIPQKGKSAVTTETFKFEANGSFTHSSLTNLLLPNNCQQKINIFQEGEATSKGSSELEFVTKPGRRTIQDTCSPTKTSTIPASSGTIHWNRYLNQKGRGEELCLSPSYLEGWRGVPSDGNCFYLVTP
jgi:hypothetical protein